MRCRQLRYRYTMVVTGRPAAPLDLVMRLRTLEHIASQTRWRPDADVYETAEAVTILVDLAGVADDDIDVSLFEDAVVVEGERRLPCEEGGVFHAAAIRQGPFRVEIGLPAAVDPERAAAHHEGGLLRIVLPRTGGR